MITFALIDGKLYDPPTARKFKYNCFCFKSEQTLKIVTDDLSQLSNLFPGTIFQVEAKSLGTQHLFVQSNDVDMKPLNSEPTPLKNLLDG